MNKLYLNIYNIIYCNKYLYDQVVKKKKKKIKLF